jgi:NAD(P)-dependent dehydrogenase (short-subunit alcohol dehydrogenase family)
MTQLRSMRIIVTGATSGLGRAMAQALTSAGARTIVTGRQRARAQDVAAQLGARAAPCELDVRDEDSVQACVTLAQELLGGVEALSRVMAADLAGTPVAVNILLPGGATNTGMIPDDASAGVRAGLLDPSLMGPPIVWLASEQAAGVHDQRIVAAEFEQWLAGR